MGHKTKVQSIKRKNSEQFYINFPMAFFWQLCFAGPLVRKIFALLFQEKETSKIADGQET